MTSALITPRQGISFHAARLMVPTKSDNVSSRQGSVGVLTKTEMNYQERGPGKCMTVLYSVSVALPTITCQCWELTTLLTATKVKFVQLMQSLFVKQTRPACYIADIVSKALVITTPYSLPYVSLNYIIY